MDERHRAIRVEIEDINDPFGQAAIALFRAQFADCAVYRAFAGALGVDPEGVKRVEEIPFLPVSFFKTADVRCGSGWEPEIVFESSGTTAGGEQRSRHAVRDLGLYRETALRGFREVYGDPDGYTILALLPGYLERKTSSLVWMAQMLMEEKRAFREWIFPGRYGCAQTGDRRSSGQWQKDPPHRCDVCAPGSGGGRRTDAARRNVGDGDRRDERAARGMDRSQVACAAEGGLGIALHSFRIRYDRAAVPGVCSLRTEFSGR